MSCRAVNLQRSKTLHASGRSSRQRAGDPSGRMCVNADSASARMANARLCPICQSVFLPFAIESASRPARVHWLGAHEHGAIQYSGRLARLIKALGRVLSSRSDRRGAARENARNQTRFAASNTGRGARTRSPPCNQPEEQPCPTRKSLPSSARPARRAAGSCVPFSPTARAPSLSAPSPASPTLPPPARLPCWAPKSSPATPTTLPAWRRPLPGRMGRSA